MHAKKVKLPLLISVQKIWDKAPHNAMTDLIIFKNKWFCTFREGDQHIKGREGQIRILESLNGIVWHTVALIAYENVDLRDPKFSITPNGQLMLLMGGTHITDEGERLFNQTYVTFSRDGKEWNTLTPILPPFEWLWRVTWHQGEAYGVSYRFSQPLDRDSEWIVTLWRSNDGVNFLPVTFFQIPGYPNETTIRFAPDNEIILLVRREEAKKGLAWLGSSYPPYEDWLWKELPYHLGGPNFIILPNNQMWAAGRLVLHSFYGSFYKTALCLLTEKSLTPLLILPSGGDCSYPGMIFHEDFLYMSYYSSHEGNTNIYLAKVDVL